MCMGCFDVMGEPEIDSARTPVVPAGNGWAVSESNAFAGVPVYILVKFELSL